MCSSPTSANEKGRPVYPSPLSSLLALCRFNEIRQTRCVYRLFSRVHHRKNRDVRTAVGFGAEFHAAFDLGENGVIGAHADILARMPSRAALTRNDVARNHMLAAERLDTKALASRVAPVARRTACFFVSHRSVSKLASSV